MPLRVVLPNTSGQHHSSGSHRRQLQFSGQGGVQGHGRSHGGVRFKPGQGDSVENRQAVMDAVLHYIVVRVYIF